MNEYLLLILYFSAINHYMNAQSALSGARGYTSSTWQWAKAHKVWSTIIALVVIFAGYKAYTSTQGGSTETRYVLGSVAQGTIIQVVSGSGQVSPTNEVTINPQASGQITRVLVKDGETVSAGQPLAYINATDEYNSVQSAKANLQGAELNLQKLQEPPTQLQLTQDQNAITTAQQNLTTTQNNLTTDYTDSYNDVVSTFLEMTTVQTDLQDIVTGTEASKGAEWNIDYYKSATVNWDKNASIYRDNTFNDYQTAVADYNKALTDYQATGPTSATSTVLAILNETYGTAQAQSTALNTANSFIQFYVNLIKNNSETPNTEAETSLTTLNTDLTKMNSQIATLLGDINKLQSDQQSITADQNTITQNQLTLQQLQAGADTLDVQQDQLTIQQDQTALQQAQADLSDYTISAPFSGTIANLELNVGDTVSNGTAAATLITQSQIATLSLNEVDAAKVALGDQATLTFDAIPNLSLTGTVIDVSPLGTVTQGVVSYAIKIGFTTQDPRVKAGMTVNADIQSAVHSNVLEVPSSAIQTVNGATYVLTFNPPITGASASSTSGVVSATAPQEVPVTIGITDNTNTEITSGLTLGQQIVRNTVSGSSATSKTAAATATSRTGGGGFGGGGGGGGAVRL